MTIEGLLNEMENVGDDSKPHYEPKHKLSDLLDPDFRIASTEDVTDFTPLKGLEGIVID
jgi:hypothetical protein